MRRRWKYIFYFVTLLLWLAALAAFLELWTRWHCYTVEMRNPFVLSRTQGEQWPVPDAYANAFAEWLQDEALRARYRGAGKSQEPLPPVSSRWEMQHRLGLFRDLDDWGRRVFANVYGLQIFLMGRDEMVTRMFPLQEVSEKTPLATVLPEAEAPWLSNFTQSVMGNPNPTATIMPSDIIFVPTRGAAPDPGGEPHDIYDDHQYCIVAEPIPDFNTTQYFDSHGERVYFPSSSDELSPRPDNAWVFYRNAEVAVMTAGSDLWEIPFFLYRKHVRRKDHVNVIGLAEDFYSNNHGFRDADFPVEKGEGIFRIVCVGASTTEEGPTNDLTYPAILEAILNRHFETNRFEVINCGISGMNSLKHRMRSADYLALAPDLIIIYNAVNDICHDLFPIWVKDASPWQQRLRKSQFINRYFNARLLPDEATMMELIEQNKMADLRFLAERAAARHVPVALCSFAAPDPKRITSTEHRYYEYCTRKEWGGRYITFGSYLRALAAYNTAIRNLCDEAGLRYIPVAEQLRGGASLFGDICHLRNPGIEAKAKIIAGFLIENNMLE